MQSPLKRPDLDDSPRDPSMMKVHAAAKDDSFDDGEPLLLDQDFDDDAKASADEYVDEFGYIDPSSQVKEAPQEEVGKQKAPVAPEAPSNGVPPPEESANKTASKTASTPNNNNGNKGPSSKKSKKTKREMNPNWKEVQETGAWGQVSNRDIAIAVVVSVVVIVGVVVGVVLGLRKSNEDDSPAGGGTKGPTMAPTMIPPETELIYAFNAIDSSDYTYLYQQDLPLTVEEYEGLMDDTSATPQARAMSWLLYEDTRDISYEAGERWALASLFYSWKGDSWVSAKNWLSSESACQWEHINCDALTGKIQEINLESNNLVGTIPPEIALLNSTQSLWLRNNSLSGPLPNEVLGSMPRLSILYLDNNQITGTISLAIRDNGALNSLFLQFNDLTGEWPRLFCSFSSSEPPPIKNFGIDCDEVSCPQQGCCSDYNCYYDN